MDLLVMVDGARGGADNMAIDRALLSACERGELVAPLLRVYGWSPPAVSLGFHQDEASLDAAAVAAAGYELVRRPTGGAAVLHHQEITYAIAGPLGIPGLGAGFKEVYDALAEIFVAALQRLGIDAHRGGGGNPEGFVCFAALGGHEIGVGGRKLVGSAFRKGRRGFLQHGSLLTGPGHLELLDLLAGGEDEVGRARRRAELSMRTTHLGELGRGELEADELADALAEVMAHRLGATPRRLAKLPDSISAEAASRPRPHERGLPVADRQ